MLIGPSRPWGFPLSVLCFARENTVSRCSATAPDAKRLGLLYNINTLGVVRDTRLCIALEARMH